MTVVKDKTKTFYEWVVETVDEYGDILDPNHGDTLAELKSWYEAPQEEGQHNRIALVRDTISFISVDGEDWLDNSTLENRQYAYPTMTDTGWQMLEFENGLPVPQKYRREFAKQNDWAM